jgi:hypothetical protein
MDKRFAGLLGGVAALALAGSAQAAIAPATQPQAGSYADLLAPIPNATQQLKAEIAAQAQAPAAGTELAQYYGYYGYYHHHHHHHHFHRYWHHHHHHHHRAFIGIPGVGGVVVGH